MNAEEFVNALRVHVMRSAVDDAIDTMMNPPGRQRATELTELSTWARGLAEADRSMLRRALVEVAHGAVFGLLAVLDGARRVDERQPPGELELWHEGREGRTKLNGNLHDILNSQSWR
jgi:hypothetical protein